MTAQTRDEIIAGLQCCDEADTIRLAERLQQCPVRIRCADGTHRTDSDIRTAQQAAGAMLDDPTIACIEYNFNGKWTVTTAIPVPARAGRPAEMTEGRRVNVYLDAPSLAAAASLGDGNVSEGIRIALARA